MCPPLPDFSNGIKRGDRVCADTRVPGVDEQWGRVTFVLGSDCYVVFDRSARRLEHRYHAKQVRKLTLLECLADPVEDPSEEWYERYDRGRY
jgi:hypothetical protein